MIQAQCTCGWTMAGPPADSWEIDEAVADHDIWCPDNRDWVNEEIEQQADDRDCIIRAIRNTATNTGYGEYVIALIEKNGTGNPSKSSPDAAPNSDPQEEERAMHDATESTASAWCPLWCTSKHKDDWCGDDGKLLRFHRQLIGRPSQATVTLVQEDHPEDTGPVMVGVYDLDRDLSLTDLDELIGTLATARQQLIATGEV